MTQKIIGVAGFKNAGKTTLVERLVRHLTDRGYLISTVKHAHHSFDIDHEGRDSFRHRAAGATEVAIVSDRRWALMHELRGDQEPTLDAILEPMSPCDLVLVEGYKRSRLPKLEVYRAEVAKPWLHPDDPSIVGIASDVPPGPSAAGRQHLPLEGYDEIATFVTAHARLPGPAD